MYCVFRILQKLSETNLRIGGSIMEKQIKRKSNVRRNRTFRFSEYKLAMLKKGAELI